MMQSLRRHLLLSGLKLFDLLNVVFCSQVAAIILALPIDPLTSISFLSIRFNVFTYLLLAVLLVPWYLIFARFGIYHSRRLSAWRGLFVDLIKATTMGTFALFAFSLLFSLTIVTNDFLALFWFIYLCIALGSRLVIRCLLKYVRIHGRNLRYLLIIGTNEGAIDFALKIEGKPDSGYRIIGFVDNDWERLPEFQQTGYSLMGSLDDLPAVLRENVIDEVVVSLPLKHFHNELLRITALCEEQGITVRIPSENIFNLKLAKARMEQFDGEIMITFYTGNMQGWPLVVKRMVDLTFALILLVLISPLLLVSALLIKVSSPGPVFFVQERLGFNKRRFWMYKFRTMVADAMERQKELEAMNEADGPVFKIKNDPRVTPVGRFLRKTSIDELPQLFNVLKGDLSLVGPRPLPVRDYAGFDQDWHRRRFSVWPGITCLWQVCGRSALSFEEWMKLDMEYIDHWSLWLDCKILLKTIPAVFKRDGAF